MVAYGGGKLQGAFARSRADFGIDEVSALVLDIGTSTTRAGYAGDDVPKAVFPTTFGYTTHYSAQEGVEPDPSDEEAGKANKEVRIHLGDEGVSLWRDGMEVGNPLQNGIGKFVVRNENFC